MFKLNTSQTQLPGPLLHTCCSYWHCHHRPYIGFTNSEHLSLALAWAHIICIAPPVCEVHGELSLLPVMTCVIHTEYVALVLNNEWLGPKPKNLETCTLWGVSSCQRKCDIVYENKLLHRLSNIDSSSWLFFLIASPLLSEMTSINNLQMTLPSPSALGKTQVKIIFNENFCLKI